MLLLSDRFCGKGEFRLRRISPASLRVSELPRVARRGMRTPQRGAGAPLRSEIRTRGNQKEPGARNAPRVPFGDPYSNTVEYLLGIMDYIHYSVWKAFAFDS